MRPTHFFWTGEVVAALDTLLNQLTTAIGVLLKTDSTLSKIHEAEREVRRLTSLVKVELDRIEVKVSLEAALAAQQQVNAKILEAVLLPRN